LAARLTPKPRSSNSWERAINLRRSAQYEDRKAGLRDPDLLLRLELIEEGIASDPLHRYRRQQIGEVICDKSEPGLAVAFAVAAGEAVLLTFVALFER
jgi:hypothetical protein